MNKINKLDTYGVYSFFIEHHAQSSTQRVCLKSRAIIDRSVKREYSDFYQSLEALDKANTKKSELHWEYELGKEKIKVEVEKKDWYYSIVESRKQ